METVVHDSSQVSHIQSAHLFNVLGDLLERHETHVKVNLVQMAAIKRIELEKKQEEVKSERLEEIKLNLFLIASMNPHLSHNICDVLQFTVHV